MRSDTEPQEQAPASVGDRMLALRNALGLTQDQLAARGSIDAHPLTYRDVLNIEKGRNRATSGRIREALAVAVEVDVAVIRDYLEGKLSLEQLLEERRLRPMKLAIQVLIESRVAPPERIAQVARIRPAPPKASALQWVYHLDRAVRQAPPSEIQQIAEGQSKTVQAGYERVREKFTTPEPKKTRRRKP